jgi:hypothetical protein
MTPRRLDKQTGISWASRGLSGGFFRDLQAHTVGRLDTAGEYRRYSGGMVARLCVDGYAFTHCIHE